MALLVQMNCEKKVALKLSKLGYEVYLPVQTEMRQWSDRKKKIERIVIPMVLFIRVSIEEAQQVKRLSFIRKFMTYPGSKDIATYIPEEQISQLRFLLENAQDKVAVISEINVGDSVKVKDGPLMGLSGAVCMAESGRLMVAIRIEGLGYACVNVPKSSLEVLVM